jgi:hypothetical protein
MLVCMSRDPLHTVTLPILVDLEKPLAEADGWLNIVTQTTRRISDRHMAVQVVQPKRDIEKRLGKIFSSKDIALFAGVENLKAAYDAEDVLTLHRAIQQVHPWEPGPWNLGTDDKPNWIGVHAIYSRVVTERLRDARLVTWCSDKERRSLPGIYCPDWKTAAFATAFIGHIRACPKCGNPFTPKTDNQAYCTPAHGVAHRTARSRWHKKRLVEEEKTRRATRAKKSR